MLLRSILRSHTMQRQCAMRHGMIVGRQCNALRQQRPCEHRSTLVGHRTAADMAGLGTSAAGWVRERSSGSAPVNTAFSCGESASSQPDWPPPRFRATSSIVVSGISDGRAWPAISSAIKSRWGVRPAVADGRDLRRIGMGRRHRAQCTVQCSFIAARGPAIHCVFVCTHETTSRKADRFSVARPKMDLPLHNSLAYNRVQEECQPSYLRQHRA